MDSEYAARFFDRANVSTRKEYHTYSFDKLRPYDEAHTYEDLVHHQGGNGYSAYFLTNMKLAIELELSIYDSVKKIILDGYIYDMLRTGGYKITELGTVLSK